ncbi:hypothetical protein GCM10023322_28280 [Rugosimonospora acidiphila]|uniref:WXG100 family type VII secretion target n=1 Tax=Rugosimonospora acidiphila TaxID=556531 RepID=A0ABP9RS82_9ACTN
MTGEKATAVDPTEALNGAGQLTTVGDGVLRKWFGLVDRINGLNDKRPWGNDDVGKKFNQYYLEGENPQATQALSAGTEMVVALSMVGDQITEAVRGTEDLDQLIAQWFGKQ